MFIHVKTYLSYNTHVVFWFILKLSYYFHTQFWSFLFFWVTFKVEPRHLLTIFVLFVLYAKASRMIHTVIRIGSRTHTCSYLLGSCLSWERTLYDHVDSIVFVPYTLVSNCYLVTSFFIRNIHEKFEFTLYAHSRSFTNITCTLSTWLCTCFIAILLLLS